MFALAALASATILATPPSAVPADYDAQAKAAFDVALFDAPSARIEALGEPRFARVKFNAYARPYLGWLACYRVNAKNRLGGYTGWHIIVFQYGDDGRVHGVVDEEQDSQTAQLYGEVCQGRDVP